MNTKLAVFLSILAGITFAGCGQTSTIVNTKSPTIATVSASTKPTSIPSITPATQEESEVNSIGEEFNNIDASKDFPDFTQNDLQQ
jgi:hypothetical protein